MEDYMQNKYNLTITDDRQPLIGAYTNKKAEKNA